MPGAARRASSAIKNHRLHENVRGTNSLKRVSGREPAVREFEMLGLEGASDAHIETNYCNLVLVCLFPSAANRLIPVEASPRLMLNKTDTILKNMLSWVVLEPLLESCDGRMVEVTHVIIG